MVKLINFFSIGVYLTMCVHWYHLWSLGYLMDFSPNPDIKIMKVFPYCSMDLIVYDRIWFQELAHIKIWVTLIWRCVIMNLLTVIDPNN